MIARRNLSAGIAALTMAVVLGACSQPLSNREKGALIGGITGAPGTGALIGGAAGAIGGALVGDQKDRQRRYRD
jgi:uncharacterized protein YcfJ